MRRAPSARRRSRKKRRRRFACCPTRSSARPKRRRRASSADARRPPRPYGPKRTDDRASPASTGRCTARAFRSSESPREVGTPVYVYSAATIRDRYERLDRDARAGAASRALHAQGELQPRRPRRAARARRRRRRRLGRRAASRAARRVRAGATSSSAASARPSASSPKRSTPDVLLINAESESGGSTCIDRLARERGMSRARVAARESRDHARRAARVHQDRRQGPQVRHSVRRGRARRRARGQRCRTSSSSASTCTSARSCRASIRIAREPSGSRRSSPSCTKRGIRSLEYLDIGGGLGVRYDTEQPPDLRRFAELVLPTVDRRRACS